MQHQIRHAPTFPLLEVQLERGEAIAAEAGAMVAMSPELLLEPRLTTTREKGFFARIRALMLAIARKLVGGDTFVINRFSGGGPGWVWLAPHRAGSIQHVPLGGQTLHVAAGSYLAAFGDIGIRARFGGMRAIFTKESAFILEVSGTGDLWIHGHGGIEEIRCQGSYLVDAAHLVAFDVSLTYTVKSGAGDAVGFFASGEGLALEFRGEGRIFVQTRNHNTLAEWLGPLLPD